MDNFKLHELATNLSDTYTPYQLAKMLVQCTELLDSSDRYQDNDQDYRNSPFCNDVRSWLKDNLTKIIPDLDFTDFGVLFIMKETYLAQQLITDENEITMWTTVGVFTDNQMAIEWLNQDLEKRSVKTVPCLDKTFAQLSVEYNNEYEG